MEEKDDGDTRRKRTPSLPSHESTVQRTAQEQRWWKFVNTLLCRPGHDYNCFSQNCLCKTSSVFTEQSQKCVKNMNPFMIERWNPLWEDNRVPHSCQPWSRQTCLWIMMIMLPKNFYCKDTENEMKSYHSKTDWAHFVWMQDSWMLLKSDSISWRMILQNSHNSQMQWPVVSTLCQETKKHLHQKVGPEGTPKLDPYWKMQLVACKVNMELRSELCLWTKTIFTRGSEFLMDWTSWSRIWTTTSRKTQKVQFEEYALKLNAGDFASRSKAKAKPQRRDSASSSTGTFPIGERTWTDVEPEEYSFSYYEVSKKLIRLLRHGSLPREDDGAIEFWRIKDNLQKHFLYCHNWSDEKWKKSMARGGGNKKRYPVLYWFIRNNLVPPSSSRSVRTQSHWSFFIGQCHYSGRFHQVHFSCRMCNQFTFHHQFRIDTVRSNFEQQTDSILSACGSHGQKP